MALVTLSTIYQISKSRMTEPKMHRLVASVLVSFNSATDPHVGADQLGVMTGALGLNIRLK